MTRVGIGAKKAPDNKEVVNLKNKIKDLEEENKSLIDENIVLKNKIKELEKNSK